jgi:hypothetical protein
MTERSFIKIRCFVFATPMLAFVISIQALDKDSFASQHFIDMMMIKYAKDFHRSFLFLESHFLL